MDKESVFYKLNLVLVFGLIGVLLIHVFFSNQITNSLLILFGLIATFPVVISGIKSIFHRKITVNLLAAIALLVSLIEHEWTSVAFISLMITSARIFGMYTETKAKKTIQSLFKLRPNQAKIKINNQIKIVDIKNINLGDLVIINAGERIPIDGVITSGTASIDQSTLTGESVPIQKKIGDQVLSSTLNLSGSLLVKTTKIGKDTTFEKLICLMEEAQTKKNKIETFAEKFAANYILFTLIGTVIIFIFTKNLSLILSLLLVTCADDIAVAIPLAFWVAIARAAQKGIIIKGGSYLEGLAKCKMLIVDKTGTLTKGKIKVDHIVSFGIPRLSLLRLAATVESVSNHPLAKAIIDYAKKQKIDYQIPKKFNEFSGQGMKVELSNQNILAGSLNFFKQEKIKIHPDQLSQINLAQNEGHNIILIARDQKFLGFIALGDEVRFGLRNTFKKLKQMGVSRIIMLTGDHEEIAKIVANQIGIEEYYANLLPEDKLAFVKKSLNSHSKVAMVGDGVNDAASLALADIGFAMGAIGSDSAIEASDIALMNDDFNKISEAFGLSHFINHIVLENFIIWGVVNLIGLILVFTGFLGPTGSAAYNFFSDFLPLLNSMRLFRYNFHYSPINFHLKSSLSFLN
jgi:Cd2+/Zn2+-exporting ATPase